MASLGPGGSFVLGATAAGYTFESLIARILDVAHQRYFGTPAAPDTPAADTPVARLSVDTTGREAQPPYAPAGTGEASAPDLVSSHCGFSDQQRVRHHIPPHTVTRFYDEQIRRSGYYEQLKQTVEPSVRELESSGTLDTSGERAHTRVNGLQHKYAQTVLLLVTDQCFSYCRYCFRKRLVGQSSKELVQNYGEVSEYIRRHPEITDVLLSGGDPFVLGTEQLHAILDHLLPIPHVTSIRFGTKGMTYYPPRFHEAGLADLFRRITGAGKTPVIVTHVDHIGEVSEETELALQNLRALGVQLFNQAVLLRTINDSPEILAATLDKLHCLGVQPYYLFQARPVRGASHFQVPLREGIEIVREVNRRLSGLAKTYRYVMSHYTGKIEILDISHDNRLRLRYHQAADPGRVGVVFSRPYCEGACWLDDLSCSSNATQSTCDPCR